ncbi:hypothetical protein ACJRO7_027867 [Eucalyptus globulus]|uniref:Uncharacterized protein n=1 Tax=Eucalyptus globulus TaxID=34317 RepID=A0ABD3K2R2_EUCGL
MRICWRKLYILHRPTFSSRRRPQCRLNRLHLATHHFPAGDSRQARGLTLARGCKGSRNPDLFALKKADLASGQDGLSRLSPSGFWRRAPEHRDVGRHDHGLREKRSHDEVARAFQQNAERDVTSWNLMISRHVSCRSSEELFK